MFNWNKPERAHTSVTSLHKCVWMFAWTDHLL